MEVINDKYYPSEKMCHGRNSLSDGPSTSTARNIYQWSTCKKNIGCQSEKHYRVYLNHDPWRKPKPNLEDISWHRQWSRLLINGPVHDGLCSLILGEYILFDCSNICLIGIKFRWSGACQHKNRNFKFCPSNFIVNWSG